jgi:hypothetical protein
MGTRLASVHDSATAIRAKTFITYIRVIMPVPNLVEATVFGTSIFHRYLVP